MSERTGGACPTVQVAAAGDVSARRQSLVLAVLLLGITIPGIDTTVVILGLSLMMADLHTDMVSMVWVIMAHLPVPTRLAAHVGRFGDRCGPAGMYRLGSAAFTTGSPICGLATLALGSPHSFRVVASRSTGPATPSSSPRTTARWSPTRRPARMAWPTDCGAPL
jgi:MFS family permease